MKAEKRSDDHSVSYVAHCLTFVLLTHERCYAIDQRPAPAQIIMAAVEFRIRHLIALGLQHSAHVAIREQPTRAARGRRPGLQ